MKISVNDIKKDMILGENVFNSYGSLILSKGISISDEKSIIKTLKENNIDYVDVLILKDKIKEEQKKSSTSASNYLGANDKATEDAKNFINDFNDVLENFENIIINKKIKHKSDKNKIEEMIKEILESNKDKSLNVFQLLQKTKDYDDTIFAQCVSCALVANKIGKLLNYKDEKLRDLTLAALFADVGKYKIDPDILNKTGALSLEEYQEIKKHIDYSLQILDPFKLSENIRDAIKYHHEQMDGTGYPNGLEGDQIPVGARIISMASMFVALTSKRPYREKYTPFEAVRILEMDYMQKLDIKILSLFIKKIASNYVGSKIILSDERKGEILFINMNFPLLPIIKLDNGDLVDLSDKKNRNLKIKEFL